jgi:TonB family protein
MVTKKILVIDYDQNSLAHLQGVLTKEGFQVVTASDGQAGWDKYNKELPDLVLMEAMLPKVHGFELCQRITSERNSQATVFIMTGVYKDRVYRTEALRTYGAAEYFEKPLRMGDLMASICSVLGKPEPRPEAAQPAKPEAAPAVPRKREKSKSDDDIFSLPPDIDRLSREIPKVDLPKARKPSAGRRETPADAGLVSLTDELLKSVVIEPGPAKKKAPGTGGGNGNGHDGVDIDQFLKSALVGLDLEKEKVKVPKTAPLPSPPAEEKPRPTPPPPPPPAPVLKPKPVMAPPPPEPAIERPKFEKPKPAPMQTPVPRPEPPFPSPKPTTILTPGDPGSDISPFFTPTKPKPEAPKETPRVPPTPPPPVFPAAAPKAPKPVEKPKPEPARPEPVRHEAAKPEPMKPHPKIPEVVPTASGDIFQHREIFEHVGEDKPKKGFPVLAAVAVAVAAVAVAAYFVLRPKPAPPVQEKVQAPAQAVETVPPPVTTVEEPPPAEVKPEPVKPKPKPQAKKSEPAPPVIEGIVPAVVQSGAPSLTPTKPGADGSGRSSAGSDGPVQIDPPSAKTEEQSPALKTEASSSQPPAQPATTVTETPADPGPADAPEGPPVQEGDLVELASVTAPPVLVKQVNPVYPSAAQRLGIGGAITINALIDEKGTVIDTGILKGILDDKGLGKAAEAAVRKWKFEPARKNGVAVKVWKSFVINFQPGAMGDGDPQGVI